MGDIFKSEMGEDDKMGQIKEMKVLKEKELKEHAKDKMSLKVEKLDKLKSEKIAKSFKQAKKDKVILDYMEKEKKMKGVKKKDKQHTKAAKAGIWFPVSKIHRILKAKVPSHSRVGCTAAIFLAAVLEYLVAELCELAGHQARVGAGKHSKKPRITPRTLQLAIRQDEEFAVLLKGAVLPGAGVMPLSEDKLKTQTTSVNSQKKKLEQIAKGGNAASSKDGNAGMEVDEEEE